MATEQPTADVKPQGQVISAPGIPSGEAHGMAWVDVLPVKDKWVAELSPGLGRLVDGIAAELGVSPDDALLRAIALYRGALDYHKQGKLIGAASNEEGPLEVIFRLFEAGPHAG
jgi:hypothetical protein